MKKKLLLYHIASSYCLGDIKKILSELIRSIAYQKQDIGIVD